MTERPLDIGLLTHSVNPRGGVVHTLSLAEALQARGHRVTVFAPAQAGQALFRAARCEVELVPVRAARGVVDLVATRRDALAARIASALRTRRFDVLHAQDAIGGNALADLRERGAIAGFVRTVHHLDDFDDPTLAAWQERAFTRASRVLCVGRLWCERLRDTHGIAADLVGNGVDLQRFARAPDPRDAFVGARLGLRPGAPLLLAVGGIEQRKNTLALLDAFGVLRATRPRAQLVIAGGASLLDHDAYGRRFAARLAASGATHNVVLTGPVADADLPALLRLADVVLMPSLREGFGLVVLEALACGTPVVVSRRAPFTEYLSPDEAADHACWADPEDPADIARAVERACDPLHRLALAHATPAVCRRHSWAASAQAHEAIYRAHAGAALPLPA